MIAVYGWSLEPSVDPAGGHHDGEHHDEGTHDDEPVAVATTPEGATEETE
jgi:hypothetical protein